MTIRITTAVLAFALDDIAWPMVRAGQKAYYVESDIAARFWSRVGGAGEALEALVDRLAIRWGIDISTVMLDRAYGS